MARTIEQERRYAATWRNKDIERARRLNRESAARRRLDPGYRAKQKEYMRAYYLTPEYKARRLARRKKNWQRELYQKVKSSAVQRGIPFDIVESDIPWNSVCPVLGVAIEPNFGGGKPADNSVSIDRIDNSVGYSPGNIIVVSYRANRIKNDATLDELQRILDVYRSLS